MSIPIDAFAQMPRISEGFFLGHIVPWGTTYDAVKREFPLQPISERYSGRWRIGGVDVERAYGLPIVNAEFTAGNELRPVTSVGYEINSDFQSDKRSAFDLIAEALSKWIGSPVESGHPDPHYGPAMMCGMVSHWARWQEKDVSLNCSIYGAPRKVRGGHSLGELSLRWENAVRAAAPYLEALLTEEMKLATIISAAEIVAKLPIGSEPTRDKSLNELTVKSQRCLCVSKIMETPSVLRQQLSLEDVAIWRMSAAEKWGISTHWDTVAFSTASSRELNGRNSDLLKGRGAPLCAWVMTSGLEVRGTQLKSLQLLEFLRACLMCS